MHRSTRAVLAALALLAASLVPGLTSSAGAATALSSVSVHGRLVVVAPERPGDHPSYGVALSDGDIVPVHGRFGAGSAPATWSPPAWPSRRP